MGAQDLYTNIISQIAIYLAGCLVAIVLIVLEKADCPPQALIFCIYTIILSVFPAAGGVNFREAIVNRAAAADVSESEVELSHSTWTWG